MPSVLLGPPEFYVETTTTTSISKQSGTKRYQIVTAAQFWFTENNSLTYKATGNPCPDFFFHVVPSTPSKSVLQRLRKAWRFDPLTTLKLVCNSRGVRGIGMSDRERFYTAALWLHRNHPETLACNAKVIAEFGYYKDLLEISSRVLKGEDVRERLKSECA